MSAPVNPSRKLRVLFVEDQKHQYAFHHLDTVELPDSHDVPVNRLGSYRQHTRLCQTPGDIPPFDILLIDINFEEDHTFEIQKGNNGLGLVHALALVAARSQSAMPFVWKIYSAAPEKIRNEPYALAVYGLLRAMERRGREWRADSYLPESLGKEVASAIVSRPDNRGLPPILDAYRCQLIAACEGPAPAIHLDYWGNLCGVIKQLENILKKYNDNDKIIYKLDSNIFDNLSFIIKIGYNCESISVRSLFGDLPLITPSLIHGPILGYFNRLRAVAESQLDLFDCVEKFFIQLRKSTGFNKCAGDRPNSEYINKALDNTRVDADPSRRSFSRSQVAVGAFVYRFVMLRSEIGRPGTANFTARRILNQIGVNEQKTFDRFLKSPNESLTAAKKCGDLFESCKNEPKNMDDIYKTMARNICMELQRPDLEKEWS